MNCPGGLQRPGGSRVLWPEVNSCIGIRHVQYLHRQFRQKPGDARYAAILQLYKWLPRELRSRDLHGLIKTFISSKASDQRDRIYALLSIATDITDGTSLVPDYTITELETIANTIRHLFGWSISDYSPHSNTDHSPIKAFFRDITIGGPCRLLEHALDTGHGHAFKIMLNKGVEPGYKELWRWADGGLLHLAAEKGQEDVVRMLLDLRPLAVWRRC